MSIARQGWGFIACGMVAVLAGVLLAGAGGWRAPGLLLAGLGLVFSSFCAYFFRDPDRDCPADPSKIYSPGDGVVLSVTQEGPGDVTTVRVFLSIFDVHVQRAPCSGVVEKVHSQPGSFAAAMRDEAKVNERCVMTLRPDGRQEPLVAEQIAGLVARRIECWPKPGERLGAGARYGIIYFGSQVAVHLPASARASVKPGERVWAGLTPIGEWTR
ncbi:MAG: phosphatidylserine decarboxylase [Elusimicrobia bacterium]|nr:phosphatidylserine decarboxylase [Elusimicrobiota bacterium]